MSPERQGPWQCEFRDLMRAVGGGLIFGIPLLFTMEMWQHGATYDPAHLLGFLGLILMANFIACLFLGLREKFTVSEALMEAVESVAIAFLISLGVLTLIGEIDPAEFVAENLGKVVFQATAISVGVSVTSAKFRERDEGTATDRDSIAGMDRSSAQLLDDLRDLGGTLLGALLFAFNVAPTEEVTLIAARLSPLQQLILFLATLLICHIILFASGFWTRTVYQEDSVFQKPWAETVMTTATSVTIAALLVVLVGNGKITSDWNAFIANTVTLALPATVGGAAGRLVT